jgi:hypothetical protein
MKVMKSFKIQLLFGEELELFIGEKVVFGVFLRRFVVLFQFCGARYKLNEMSKSLEISFWPVPIDWSTLNTNFFGFF